MLRGSCVRRIAVLGNFTRVPPGVRQTRRDFGRHSFYQTNSHSILLPHRAVSLSTVPGSSMFLWGCDACFHYRSKRHLLLTAPTDETESSSTASTRWIATSPLCISPSKTNGILYRIIRWLQKCWRDLSRFCFITIRTSEVILRLSPLIILTPAALVSTKFLNTPMISNLAWSYALKAIQGLGPVAVKFCQWAATRRDIFPPVLCDRLSILHDNGYPHSWDWTRRVLTQAFGDYESKGLVVNEVIGCGSAAQVYRGTLTVKYGSGESQDLETKREVAIKVLHPRFQDLVDRDLEFIEIVANSLHALPITFIRMLNLPRAVEDFSVVLRHQADLKTEAENLKIFRTNFFRDSQQQEEQSSIIFPQPVDGWASHSVILEDYVHDAVPIAHFLLDTSEEGMHRRKELAGPLLRAFLKMVFVDNFIHGDLHPGNVLVKTTLEPVSSSPWDAFWRTVKAEGQQGKMENDERKTKRSIVFLDAGIAISLTPNDRRNLVDLFRAVVFNDGKRAGRLMVERAKYERCSETPGGVDMFSEGIGEIVSEFHDRRKEGLTLGAVRIGVLLRRVLDLCRVHGVEIDPAMASVVISTLVLEGLGRSLSPDLDLLTFARPFLMHPGRI